MKQIQRILFATDFSEASASAQARAVQLAREHHAELHVLHVQVASPTMYMPEFGTVEGYIDERQKEDARARMDQLTQAIDMPVTTAMRFDLGAAPAVIAYAEEQGIDLIVAGSHGRSGFKKLFLGSEAQDLVRSAPVATLIVPLTDASSPTGNFRRVLAPVDLSSPSRSALLVADDIAQSHGAELVVLHAVDDWFLPPHYPMSLETIQHEHAAAALDTFLAEIALQSTPKRSVLTGSPARTIVDTAQTQGVDLIVMATAGLGSWEHFFVGSVTERVLGHAPCAVWICRADRETEAPGS